MKTREVPEEIKNLFIKAQALRECRDQAIKSLIGKRRAIYYAKKHIIVRDSAWRDVFKLYPDMIGTNWRFNVTTQQLEIDD